MLGQQEECHPVVLTFAGRLAAELEQRWTSVTSENATSSTPDSRLAAGRVASLAITSAVRASHREGGIVCAQTIFDGDGQVPDIDFSEYVERALTYTRVSREALIVSLMNLDRYLAIVGSGALRPTSVHRLWFTSLVVSSKLVDDNWCTNRHWARVAGVESDEINALERQFLGTLEFNVIASANDFQIYAKVISSLSPWVST